ncbi:MAG: hypothetical protein JW963_12685 [Anaerolineales bacterium]|nr:hypothetical protein [Anaerolineales bacterium]
MGREAWYVLHSKPRKKSQLNAYLQSQGIETFSPTVRLNPVNPRSSKIRPYFPRYLFAHADLEEVDLSLFEWAPGAHCLVTFDGRPARVPKHVICQIKRRVEKIEAAGGFLLDGLHLPHS